MCRSWLALVAVPFMTAGLLAQQARPAPDLTPEQYGRRIFQTRCAMCHVGADAGTESRDEAAAPTAAPSSPVLNRTRIIANEAAVREKIKKGSARMPGYQYALTDEQITQVIAFLKTVDKPLTVLSVPRPGE